LPNLPRGLFANFHNTIGELYTIVFFPIKTDDETTNLVVYDIYFIKQLLKNDNNKNKQTKHEQTNYKQTKNKQAKTNKQIKKAENQKLKNNQTNNRSIEIVHKSLLHMHLSKKTHSNGDFIFCQTILRLFQIILLITEEGSRFILS
jgi:hypothetical protein